MQLGKQRLLYSSFSWYLVAFLVVSLAATAQTTAPNEWTWLGGNGTVNVSGVYGILGTPAPGNIPGTRSAAAFWTDKSGNLWLFGGFGYDVALSAPSPTWGNLNDLWEFNPSANEWAWMGGSDTFARGSAGSAVGQPGVYGTLGTAAAGNIPGGRMNAASWTDINGNFWLFGGFGEDSIGGGNGAPAEGPLNDLWEFNPSSNQWAWMGGSSTLTCNSMGENCARPGVYGALGVPATGNIPGGRELATSWVDSGGNFWLFGGIHFDASGNYLYLNDLWEFNPATNEWAWMGGSNAGGSNSGQAGTYGTLRTPAGGNLPGSRFGAMSWTRGGDLWLLGGYGADANGTLGYVNDLWEFNPSTNEWAWMSGSSASGSSGVYGALGAPAVANVPGGRAMASTWLDSSDDLWLFGGGGFDSQGNLGNLNDLWEFNPSTNEWAWMSGSSSNGQIGAYGTLGTPAVGNVPGGRSVGAAWTGANGTFLLFGGEAGEPNNQFALFNDLWAYQPQASAAAATPGFSVATGTYNSAQSVMITDSTPGAVIYYTTNGTTPTTSSTIYSNAISVASTETLEAIATANGYSTSSVAAASYTISLPAASPTFSVPAGTYTSAQTVAISDTTAGATIYYTTNGSTPTTSSAVYSGVITVSSTETLEAIATAPSYSTSSVASAAYTINIPKGAAPTFSVASGTYTSTQTVSISDTTPGATIYYTTNGTTPTASSAVYSSAITVSSSETLEAIATASGYTTSNVATAAYMITPPAATPSFSVASGTYTSTQTVSISDSTAGSTIYYTTNGTAPTTSSTVYIGAITVSSSETLEAIATASGYSTSNVATAAYTINIPQAAAPTFSVASGTYITAQPVSISDATAGATIYFTTNGTTPTTSSTVYSGAITVSSSETLEAVATASGYTASSVATAAYTISPPAATPTFSPAPGTFTSSQSVTISESSAGSTIYYTTNGTAPTTSSTVYSGPITVASTETIEALATAAGDSNSSIATATYTINLPAPDFSAAATPASQTVTGGQSATATVSITPLNGFNSAVSFACSGLPTGSSCSFSPATVTPSGAAASTTVTVTTTSAEAAVRANTRPLFPVAALAVALCCFGLRKRRRLLLLLILGLGGLGILNGCGGGGSGSGGGGGGGGGSQSATYTITVNATSGSLQHATTFSVTVD